MMKLIERFGASAATAAGFLTPKPGNPKSVGTARNRNKGSLLDRIRRAKNASEVRRLERLGVAYEGASKRTRARWRSAAATRLAELSATEGRAK